MQAEINPVGVFASSFCFSAFGGLAALLRSGNKVTAFSILSAMLNSGCLGLGISLLWFTKFKDNIYYLVGICTLAGLGGQVTIDFVLKAILNGGLRIGNQSVQMKQDEQEKK